MWHYHPIKLNREQGFLDSFARSPTAKARPQQMAFSVQNNIKICGSCVAPPIWFCHAQTHAHAQRGSTCISLWCCLLQSKWQEERPGHLDNRDLVIWVFYCPNAVKLPSITSALAVNNGSGWTVLLHSVCRQYQPLLRWAIQLWGCLSKFGELEGAHESMSRYSYQQLPMSLHKLNLLLTSWNKSSLHDAFVLTNVQIL